MFKFKKKTISDLSLKLNEFVSLSQKNPAKTYIFVKFAHKDKKITYHICELKGDIIELNGLAYYISAEALYSFELNINKIKHKIVTTDVYEGITTNFNPLENRLTQIYNETVQKAIYLYIQSGIMESKLKQKMNMRTMIIAALIGIAAIFIFIKMFSG